MHDLHALLTGTGVDGIVGAGVGQKHLKEPKSLVERSEERFWVRTKTRNDSYSTHKIAKQISVLIN